MWCGHSGVHGDSGSHQGEQDNSNHGKQVTTVRGLFLQTVGVAT